MTPMRPPARVKPRKLLIASIGVASMTYVATTSLIAACGGSSSPGGTDSGKGGDAVEDFPVANLVAPMDSRAPGDSPNDSVQIDDFPVANLVAMPDASSG